MKGSPTSFNFEDDDRSLIEFFVDNTSYEPGTYNNYKSAWRRLTEFAEEEEIDILEIDEQQVAEFCKFLKQRDSLSEKSAETHIRFLSRMVDWYTTRGVLDYNPFSMVLDDSPFSYPSETIKREVEIDELRDALQGEIHPITLTLVVLLLKTGVRIGEAVNLDHRDIHLNHPINEEMPTPREEIANMPDSLFIDSSISEGEIHNGELREDGNKPQSYRAIPVDSELKQTLVWYIAMAPASQSDANPLFRQCSRPVGKRFLSATIRELYFNPWAKAQGWYDPTRSDRVTPHWCRHWFTTMLRRRIDQDEIEIGSVEDYVKGLRGDTGDDVIETYTHKWGDNQWIRDAYIDNIPSLFPD